MIKQKNGTKQATCGINEAHRVGIQDVDRSARNGWVAHLKLARAI